MIKLTCKITEIYQQFAEGHMKRGIVLRTSFQGSSWFLQAAETLSALFCEGVWL